MALRSRLFVEELVISGVQPEMAQRHVRDWTLPENLKSYQATVLGWLADPYTFLRIVCDAEQIIHGLFIASMAKMPTGTSHYVSSIQLAPSIRRQGVGSALFADFAQATSTSTAPTKLHVFANNEPARRFYERLGFTDTGARKTIKIGATSNEPGESALAMLLVKQH